MSGAIVRSVKLEDVILDWNLYPRTEVGSQHVFRMINAVNAGRELPPVIICARTMKLVDGWHRFDCHKRLKRSDIQAELRDYPTEADMFADAVEANADHGRSLSLFDVRRIALKAESFGLERERVCSIVRITPARLDQILEKRATSGTTMEHIPIKHGLESFTNRVLTPKQERLVKNWGGMKVQFYIRQVIDFLDSDAYDGDKQTAELMDRLVALWSDVRRSMTA